MKPCGLPGEYSSEELRLNFVDRLELVEGEGGVPFLLAFRVYPRVLAAAVEAARFLLEAAGVGLGEQPTKLRGGGLEYAESRPYVPGDSLRRMDWKATARLGRLIVKDFYIEGGVRTHIVFEASAPDTVSLDKLSASFLRAVITFAREGHPLGLTVHDGDSVLYHGVDLQPVLAITQAMQYALKGIKSGFQQLYEVLEPRAAIDLRAILRELDEAPQCNSWRAGRDAVGAGDKQPIQVLEEFIAEEEGRLQLLIISSLQCDPVPILEVARHTRNKGWMLHILQPTKPWIWHGDLENSHHVWRHHSKLSRVFNRVGVKVATSVEEVYKNVSSIERLLKIPA